MKRTGWPIAVAFALALLVAHPSAQAAPGDVITITVTASCPRCATTSASTQVVVLSPAYRSRPIYVPARARVYVGEDKRPVTITDHRADGMLVRFPVVVGQSVMWFDGIQLRDGRVWVDGRAVEPWQGSPAASAGSRPV